MERIDIPHIAFRSAVTDLQQDSKGFIWLATRRGLFRFDGFELRQYSVSQADRPSESSLTSEIVIDSIDRIWCIADDGSINRLDPTTGRVESFDFATLEPTSKPTGILELVLDSGDRPWVLASNGTLYAGETSGNLLTVPEFGGLEAPFIDLIKGPDGSMYALTRDGVLLGLGAPGIQAYRAAAKELFVMPYWHELSNPTAWRHRMWLRLLTRRRTISICDTPRVVGMIRQFDEFYGDTAIADAWIDSAQRLWVATDDRRLLVYRDESGRFEHVDLPDQMYAVAQEEAFLRIFEDITGTVWVGSTVATYNWNPYRRTFGRPQFVDENGNMLSAITAIYRDTSETLWVGTLRDGLYSFARTEGEGVYTGVKVTDESVLSILEDSHGDFYLGTANSGLMILDRATKTARQIAQVSQVTDIHEDQNGRLWFATFINGIGELDRQTGRVEFWEPLASAQSLKGFDATCILEDRSGNIWAGSDGGGLIKLLPDRTSYSVYSAGYGEQALSDERVLSLAEDPSGMIWAGTRNGLNRINPETNAIERYFAGSIVPDNVICAIETDADGDLWFSTFGGLSRYDPESNSTLFCSYADGLKNVEYTPGVSCFAGGWLFFGGPGGVDAVEPELLHVNVMPPPVAFTSFLTLRGGSETPVSAGRLLTGLKLPYEANGFHFEYAVLDFADPARNHYAHMLEGFDSKWQQSNSRQYGRYSGLQPGKYTLKIKGANSDGTWNEAGISIPIEILAPFWMTLPFQISAVILAILLVIGIVVVRTNRIERHRIALLKEVEERKIAEMKLLAHQARLRALASELTLSEERQRRQLSRTVHDDIGHALLGSKVKLRSLEKRPGDDEVRAELRGIIDIIEGALKTARSLSTELSPPSLYRFGIESATENLVERFGLEYGIRSSVTLANKGAIKEEVAVILYQSLRELLINILKHSRAKSINVTIDTMDSYISMALKDDGIGFDPTHILEDDVGGGFGLFSIRIRLESVGGKLEIDSKPGRGTTVRMLAPLCEGPQK